MEDRSVPKSLGYDLARGEGLARQTPPEINPTLPSSATVNLNYLPPVGMQSIPNDPKELGAPPTCTAWATTYGVATFMAAQAAKTSPSDPSLQASPGYIYCKVMAQINDTDQCWDSQLLSYFDLLRGKTGTPSLASAQYAPSCRKLWATYKAGAASDPKFAISRFRYFDACELDSVKSVLASGVPLAYATALSRGFFDFHYRGSGPIPVLEGPFEQIPNIGHCMLIIGYDDNMGKDGAFLIQNSFGTDWGTPIAEGTNGTNGYVWIGYHLFRFLVGTGANANPAFFVPAL